MAGGDINAILSSARIIRPNDRQVAYTAVWLERHYRLDAGIRRRTV